MRHGRLALLCLLICAPAAHAAGENDRYALAQGCYDLTSGGQTVASQLRLKPTALGKYLLYTKTGKFLTSSYGEAAAPSEAVVWTVEGTSGAFTLTVDGKKLDGTFGFAEAADCAIFPESEVNVDGAPSRYPTPWGVIGGFLDAHMHWMSADFLGGNAHCGQPWSPYGITVALTDCPDHSIPGSPGNILEAALGGSPTHDTVGWPTFGYWPSPDSLTHENTYYKWVERAWRGGLRLFVNLYVDNAALCKVLPGGNDGNDCNEMKTVRLQMQKLRDIRDYIDAQEGGPGKGWMVIVDDPFEARRAIAAGKLAVIQGIEVSQLFDCTLRDGVPNCDKEKIDQQLDAVYNMGVRAMELVNKFDNAFVGVAGDSGVQGPIVNAGNREETGRFWDMETCKGVVEGDYDKTQLGGEEFSAILGASPVFATLRPDGAAPVYPPPPHCNTIGLSSLGQYLLERMMAKGMIVDPDHMSVLARNATMDLLEARRYSGVVSSHSWSTPSTYPRIYKLGGVVTPIASSSKSHVEEWKTLKAERDKRFYFGFGYGADMNGFHHLGGPRGGDAEDPVAYPFKSWDGKQTIDRQVTGQRTWDINVDGVAQYGMFPDWIEDIRKLGGDQIVRDMGRGSEAYLEMWERALGVPMTRPVSSRSMFTAAGLFRVKLGVSNEALLRSAGQPEKRGPYVWRYGIQKRPIKNGKVYAVIAKGSGKATLIMSTGLEHSADGINVGDEMKGSGLRFRKTGTKGRRFVYGVKKGEVTWTGVTSLRGKALQAAISRLPVA
jgi:hypothetical protein